MAVSTTSVRQGDAVAGLGHARAQFVVVGQVVDQRCKAANLVERIAADGQRGAEAVVQAAFNHAGKQHAGLEVGGDAQRLQPRGQSAVGAAAIERGHQANFRQRYRAWLAALACGAKWAITRSR